MESPPQPAYSLGMDQERLWKAVEARDARWDGKFVFAVKSTGVYCRPSCPARRPRREQVRYFSAPDAAEMAGFRACRRCKPREDAGLALVERACRRIEAGGDGRLRLDELAKELGLTAPRLARLFRKHLGITPRQYGEARRIDSFRSEVRNGRSVTDALYEAGYGSGSRLYERAPAELGMTPATYRRGGAGMRIAYSVVECGLGRLLVAATGRGICAVSLGSAEAGLEAALFLEFPGAEIHRDDDRLRQWTGALVRQLEGAEPSPELPLDVRATGFQRRVWEELRRIPWGQTRTYGEVARRLGQPAAARAVARACATNPAALAIPCHRVVPAGGGTGGYRWGAARKSRLLKAEAACSLKSSE
jgi:AraC family transcriptional regulator, regulatory protein of adaptative response / methylated-DNA-[protein]-cysteine methyltransferase